MWVRSSVALIALVTGCAAAPKYVFHPSAQTAREDAPGQLDGHAAAAYAVPAQGPRGEVKLAPLGFALLISPDASDAPPRYGLHVRMVVRNGDRDPWSVDTSAQTVDLGVAPESPLLALLDGRATEIAVVMPGETRTIDLYYDLSGGQALASSLRLQWSVRTPEGTLARATSSFDAQLVPEPDPPPPPPTLERKQMAKRLADEPTERARPPSTRPEVADVPSWRD